MPHKLESFPAAPSQRYPWDQLLNGEVWKMIQGEDYTSRTRTVLANARIQAKRRGGTVRSRVLEDEGGESLVIQFRRA